MDDEFGDAAQPKCPECGTVLVDIARGYECRGCQLTFLPNLPNESS